ncbi:MAG: MFS transporter [Clostridium lundense]|nr:MFS transporter [Clostridium lundense]
METEKKVINKNFMLYLIGRMVSDIGTSIQMMIMPLYIIDIRGTAATIGLFSFISFLPTLLGYIQMIIILEGYWNVFLLEYYLQRMKN